MPSYLGIDTSNYTTSVALYNSEQNRIEQLRKLLPVKDGTLGLRQSDAVFSHVAQLPGLMEQLFANGATAPTAVGVSARPRDAEGSYMPCFLVGELVARSIAASAGIPIHRFSHQAGHIMAALYGADKLELAEKPFIALHVSGGTTDCMLVRPDKEKVLHIEMLATSLDLKAGQAVDRVGGMLGLAFPAGPKLDELAQASQARFASKPVFKGDDCCLSGVENICAKMKAQGAPDADIALCCIDFIAKAVDGLTQRALAKHPGLPVLYCGGVMSNTIIRQRMEQKYGGFFAPPQLSSDNGCGAALLAYYKEVRL